MAFASTRAGNPLVAQAAIAVCLSGSIMSARHRQHREFHRAGRPMNMGDYSIGFLRSSAATGASVTWRSRQMLGEAAWGTENLKNFIDRTATIFFAKGSIAALC